MSGDLLKPTINDIIKNERENKMKSSFIAYNYGLNTNHAEISTDDGEYFEMKINSYEDGDANYITKSELIELSEWLKSIAEGKEK